jgi:hypothetical protein
MASDKLLLYVEVVDNSAMKILDNNHIKDIIIGLFITL